LDEAEAETVPTGTVEDIIVSEEAPDGTTLREIWIEDDESDRVADDRPSEMDVELTMAYAKNRELQA
jgi:hypothetical protein